MKTIRTHEENLDLVRQRHKGVVSKADAAERKLSKMDVRHKDRAVQTALLEGLRNLIRELDEEMMTEEAKLGDLKRTLVQFWMTLKFGGMEECCRKGIVRLHHHICSLLLMTICRSLLNQESLSWPSFLRW